MMSCTPVAICVLAAIKDIRRVVACTLSHKKEPSERPATLQNFRFGPASAAQIGLAEVVLVPYRRDGRIATITRPSQKHLDRNGAAQAGVLRAIDLAHTAFAKTRFNPIGTDLFGIHPRSD